MYKKSNPFVKQSSRQFPGFLNNSVKVNSVKLKIDMLYHMKNTFQNTSF